MCAVIRLNVVKHATELFGITVVAIIMDCLTLSGNILQIHSILFPELIWAAVALLHYD